MTAGAGPSQGYGWRLGAVHGIPVFIGRSWPIIAAVVVLTFGPQVRDPVGGQGGVFGYAVAVAYALLLLLSVLTHEAAHAVTARRFGYRVDRVVADLWGGHTVYEASAARPGASAAIAVVGPAANLALALVASVVHGAVGAGVPGLLLGALAWTNLFVGLFNLLPGLPLDGGYLVDALVWRVSGDRNRGLIVAGWSGRLLTVAVVVWFVARPLLQGEPPSLFTIVWAGLVGAFLWAGATNAIRSGTSRRVLENVPLARVLRPVHVAGTWEPVAAVLSRLGGLPAATGGPTVVAVEPGGSPVGLVDLHALASVAPARRGEVPVAAVVTRQPDGWVVVVPDPQADVSAVVAAMVTSRPGRDGASGPRVVLAVGPGGQVLGTVSVDDLNTAFGG